MSATRSDDARRRVFFAVLPDAATRASLAALADRLRHDGRLSPAGTTAPRLTPVHNLHLTLLFVGTLPAEPITRCRAVADACNAELQRARDAEWTLDRLGGFDGARVAHASPAHVPDALRAAHAALRNGLSVQQVPFDDRSWSPHVTLARHARCASQALAPPIRWTSAWAGLALSESTGRGVVYRPLDPP